MTDRDNGDGLDELFGGLDSSEPAEPTSRRARRRAPEEFGADELAAPPPGAAPERPLWTPPADAPPAAATPPAAPQTTPMPTSPPAGGAWPGAEPSAPVTGMPSAPTQYGQQPPAAPQYGQPPAAPPATPQYGQPPMKQTPVPPGPAATPPAPTPPAQPAAPTDWAAPPAQAAPPAYPAPQGPPPGQYTPTPDSERPTGPSQFGEPLAPSHAESAPDPGAPWSIPAEPPASGAPAWSQAAYPGPTPTAPGVDDAQPPARDYPGLSPAAPLAAPPSVAPPAAPAAPAGPAAAPGWDAPAAAVPPPVASPPASAPGWETPAAPSPADTAAPTTSAPTWGAPADQPPADQPPAGSPETSWTEPEHPSTSPAGGAFDLPAPPAAAAVPPPLTPPPAPESPSDVPTRLTPAAPPPGGGAWSLGSPDEASADESEPPTALRDTSWSSADAGSGGPDGAVSGSAGVGSGGDGPPASDGPRAGDAVVPGGARTAVLVPTGPLLPSAEPVEVVEQDELAKSTGLEKAGLAAAFVVPPVGLVLSLVNAGLSSRRRGWVTRLIAASVVVGVIGSVFAGIGGVVLWNQYQVALEHDRLEVASAQLCATLERNPELSAGPLVGWPSPGRSIPDSLALMQEFVDRWTAVASASPEEIAAGAQTIADAGQQVYGSVEIARRIDDDANQQVIASAVSASGVTEWYQEYCVIEP